MATTERSSTKRTSDDERIDEVPRHILKTFTAASAEAGDRLADATAGAERVVRQADASLRRSSDQTLGIVGALSVGMAMGLLIGGSNRLFIGLALIPAALVAGIVLERLDRHTPATGRQSS